MATTTRQQWIDYFNRIDPNARMSIAIDMLIRYETTLQKSTEAHQNRLLADMFPLKKEDKQ